MGDSISFCYTILPLLGTQEQPSSTSSTKNELVDDDDDE